MMPQAVQDRILYHYEAFKISEEQSKGKAWLEKYKNYRPVVKLRGDNNEGI
jgi:hypothetical protein